MDLSQRAVARMDLDMAYLWTDLLNNLDTARTSTDDSDSLSGCLDTIFWPSACVATRSFERISSLDVGYVGLGCEALDDPVMIKKDKIMGTLTVQRIK